MTIRMLWRFAATGFWPGGIPRKDEGDRGFELHKESWEPGPAGQPVPEGGGAGLVLGLLCFLAVYVRAWKAVGADAWLPARWHAGIHVPGAGRLLRGRGGGT